jgi:hypothetical protein
VQRLDRHPDLALSRVRDQRGDRILDHAARGPDVAIRRRAADQHERIGLQLRGLVDRPAVVLDAQGALLLCGGRKHAPAADAGHPQAGVAHQAPALR